MRPHSLLRRSQKQVSIVKTFTEQSSTSSSDMSVHSLVPRYGQGFLKVPDVRGEESIVPKTFAAWPEKAQ
jgi:hypothetical protein